MFTRRWWLFLGIAALGTALGVVVATGIGRQVPQVYESRAVLEFPSPPASGPAADANRERLLAPEVLMGAAAKLGWPEPGKANRQETLDRLLASLEVTATGNRITLRARHAEPRQARDIAWNVVEAFGEYWADAERRDQAATLAGLQQAVAAQQQSVAKAEESLTEIARELKPEEIARITAAPPPKAAMSDEELMAAGRALAARIRQQAEAKRVLLREAPEVPLMPVSPGLSLMMGLGGLVGLGLSLPVAWRLARFRPAPGASAAAAT